MKIRSAIPRLLHSDIGTGRHVEANRHVGATFHCEGARGYQSGQVSGRTQQGQCVPDVRNWIVGQAVPNMGSPTNSIQAVGLKDSDIWYRLRTPRASDECKQRRTGPHNTRHVPCNRRMNHSSHVWTHRMAQMATTYMGEEEGTQRHSDKQSKIRETAPS
jgi:hypothetical protein